MSEALIIAILGSSVLSALISNIFSLLKDRINRKEIDSKEKERRRKIDRLLLLSAFKNQARAMLYEGERTELNTKELQEYYDTYKDEGGDGFADDLYSQAMSLPFKS